MLTSGKLYSFSKPAPDWIRQCKIGLVPANPGLAQKLSLKHNETTLEDIYSSDIDKTNRRATDEFQLQRRHWPCCGRWLRGRRSPDDTPSFPCCWECYHSSHSSHSCHSSAASAPAPRCQPQTQSSSKHHNHPAYSTLLWHHRQEYRYSNDISDDDTAEELGLAATRTNHYSQPNK